MPAAASSAKRVDRLHGQLDVNVMPGNIDEWIMALQALAPAIPVNSSAAGL